MHYNARRSPILPQIDGTPLSRLRAVHNALRNLFADALASAREGLRTGIKMIATSATVVGLVAAASYLSAMGRALPNVFGWLSRLVAYLQSPF